MRIEGRKVAKESMRPRQTIQARDANPVCVNEIAGGLGVEQRGIDRCQRPRIGNVSEDALGTPALIQVVVDERDACYWELDSRGTINATVGSPKYFRATRWTSAGVTAAIAASVALR